MSALKVFEAGMLAMLQGSKVWGTDTVKCRLLMSNTTADTEHTGINFLSNFTTLDTCDSAGYADATITCNAPTKDAGNNRVLFNADDHVFSSLAACTRQIVGGLLYFDGANDAARIPIALRWWANAKTPNGSDFPFRFPASGAMYWTATRGTDNVFLFLEAIYQLALGALDLENDTIKAHLVMSNTTVDTEDPTSLAGFTTLDVCDGSGYAAQTITTPTLTRVDADELIKFTADDLTFPTLSAGTRNSIGTLIYLDGVDNSARKPILYLPGTAADNGNGSDFDVTFPASLLCNFNCPRE